MFIIGTDNLSVSFGEKIILDHVSFSVNQGEKISIVGVNGAGKTTLMRLFFDQSLPHTGNVFIAKGKTIGHLNQQSNLDPEDTVYEAAINVFSDLRKDEILLETLSEELKTNFDEKLISRFSALQQKFEQKGGYEYKSRAKGTLIRIGFPVDKLGLKIGALSGGQKTILQLALLILEEPDILLLDEPTNHLDIQSLTWLEEKLKKIRSTVLLISHDRLFLDRVTDKTLELENGHGKLYNVPYSKYRQQKAIDREIQEKQYNNQQKEIARMQAFIEQQKRWNREKNIIAAESRQKAIDRMVKVEKVQQAPDALSFQFSQALESGNDVLSVKKLCKDYPNTPLFQNLSFEVKKKDRLLIIGANGSGKSTLLQILAGNSLQNSGTFQFGYNVRMGYYDQYQHLNDEKTVLEEIWEGSSLNHTQIRSLLATFLFRGDDVYKEVHVLSGGERARLVLAKLMQKRVNLLLLDEPTNHLDIESREALEDAILQFDGTVIAVSHDRYFINKLATRILAFQGNGEVFQYNGNYFDYQNYIKEHLRENEILPSTATLSVGAEQWQVEKRRKQDERKKRNRIERIEKEISDHENRIREIDEKIQTITTDYVTLQSLYEEKDSLQKKCDDLLFEWTTLEDS